jgi:hypothetical protein
MELAQDRVQWWALVLAVLNLRVLPPDYTTDQIPNASGCGVLRITEYLEYAHYLIF